MVESISGIEKMTASAIHVWFDRKGRKDERFKEKAQQLLECLSPEVLSDPRFYQEINGPTHLDGLEILVRLIPQNDKAVHGTFVAYLHGIVSHRVTMTHPSIHGEKIDVDGQDGDYKKKLGPYLRIFLDLPADYLDMIYREVGLPVDSKPTHQPLVNRVATPGVEPPIS